MNPKVKEYLDDLNFEGVCRDGAYLIPTRDNPHISYEGRYYINGSRGIVYKYDINGDKYFAKPFSQAESYIETRSEVLLGEVFNDLDVPSVRARFLKHNNEIKCVITKDVRNISDIDVCLASECDEFRAMNFNTKRLNGCDRQRFFDMLTNSKQKKLWKLFMTDNGKKSHIEAYLAGLLLTNQDMHDENVFLYKDKSQSKKNDGVILIDNELTGFAIVDGADYMESGDLYDAFMHQKVGYFKPAGDFTQEMTYPELIKTFNSEIQSGVIDKKYIPFLHKVRDYDLSNKIKEVEKETEVTMGSLYDVYSWLWEYMQDNLEL